MTVADLILTEHIGRHIAVEHGGRRSTGYLEDIIDAKDYPRFRPFCEVVVDLSNSNPDLGDGYHLLASYADPVTFLDEAVAS